MGDAGHQRIVMLFLNGLAGRQGERPHGPAVKRAEKGDVELAPGVPSGKLEGGLYGLGP